MYKFWKKYKVDNDCLKCVHGSKFIQCVRSWVGTKGMDKGTASCNWFSDFSITSCTAFQLYCSTNQELNTVYILESQHFCWHCSTNEENKKSELVISLSAYRSKQSCEDEVINLALISVIGFCFVSDNLIKSNLLILCFFFFAWFNQPLPLHLIRSFVNLFFDFHDS